MIQNNLHI